MLAVGRSLKGTPRQGLLANLRQARRRPEVERVLDALGPLSNVKEFSMAISAWGRARQPQRSLALLDEMRTRGVQPDVISFNAAISACGAAGRWEHALSLLEEMPSRGVEPDAYSFNAAISACGAGKQWERALSLLLEMRTRGVEPDAYSFNAAISACEKAKQWERALSLLDDMRTRGVEPNVISFNAAISACGAGGQWERALSLLEEMRTRGVEPSVYSFSAAISACGAGGQWERALELLEEVQVRGVAPNVISFNAAISACEQRGEAATASIVYSEAVALKLLPRMHNGKIDLHALSAPVARVAVAWSLECLARGEIPLPDNELVIVTGKGRHSEGNVAVIKPQIEAMLSSAEFAGLDAIEDARNTGVLVVRGPNLRAWVAARSRDWAFWWVAWGFARGLKALFSSGR